MNSWRLESNSISFWRSRWLYAYSSPKYHCWKVARSNKKIFTSHGFAPENKPFDIRQLQKLNRAVKGYCTIAITNTSCEEWFNEKMRYFHGQNLRSELLAEGSEYMSNEDSNLLGNVVVRPIEKQKTTDINRIVGILKYLERCNFWQVYKQKSELLRWWTWKGIWM